MAFLEEDGTGIAGANSYSSVAAADAYLADRPDATWTAASNTQKQEALIAATDYIDLRWGGQFKGVKADSANGLEWPRTGAYDSNGFELTMVPTPLLRATVEYAVRALSAALLSDPAAGYLSGQQVTRLRQKVGDLEVDTQYSESPGAGSRIEPSGQIDASLIKSFPKADLYLRNLVKSVNSMSGRVARA